MSEKLITYQDIQWFNETFKDALGYEEWSGSGDYETPEKDHQVHLIQDRFGLNTKTAEAIWQCAAALSDNDEGILHYAECYIRDVKFELHKVEVREHSNLAALTAEQFWNLPVIWSVHDDRKANIAAIKEEKPDIVRAKNLSQQTHLDYELAKLFTQCLKLTHILPQNKGRHYEHLEFMLVDQANRALQVTELAARKDKTLNRVLDGYIGGGEINPKTPEQFLKWRIINIIIFTVVVIGLEFLARSTGKPILTILISLMAVLGFWIYSFTPKQYKARKLLGSYLQNKGVKS